jgi:ferredoxin
MSERVLEVCSQKNIGTTLMKVNPIRSYNQMKEWIEKDRISKGKELSERERENLIRMEKKVKNAQEFLTLSGSRLTSRDKELLASYSRECGSLYCRHACRLCESACPYGVPVRALLTAAHHTLTFA